MSLWGVGGADDDDDDGSVAMVVVACEVFKTKFPLIEILMSGNNQNSN